MPDNSCIIYTSIYFPDFAHLKSEFEKELNNIPGQYEIRYDLFDNKTIKNLEDTLFYLNSHNVDYIFTFRSNNKDEIENVYKTAVKYSPPIIDIDVNSFIFKRNIFNKSKLMISYHGINNDNVPALLNRISELKPDIYKIALTYTDREKFIEDLHYIYTYRKNNGIKIAFIPMGIENSFLRIVSAYLVSDYSYASYSNSTAPGQISQEQFKTVMAMFKERCE
jgi:3-dehydroquinate dehydratase-1